MPRTLNSEDQVRTEPNAAHREFSRMMHEGRSFSGREKHCVFLNTRGPRFATISTVSGLDYPEDGRALAQCDWDHDGDVDLWVSNRTAPRLRLLRNDTP